jgi:hypothetical protein
MVMKSQVYRGGNSARWLIFHGNILDTVLRPLRLRRSRDLKGVGLEIAENIGSDVKINSGQDTTSDIVLLNSCSASLSHGLIKKHITLRRKAPNSP